ncbi:MAG: hypothetical protein ACRDN9_16215 [Streptosporangiaceae bacterium]
MAEGLQSSDSHRAAWSLATDETTGAGIPCPPGWTRVERSVASIALVAPHPPDDSTGATITVSVERPEHAYAKLPAYSDRTLERLGHALTDVSVLSCDAARVSGREGRRLVAVYRDDGRALTLQKWWTSVDGLATTLTGTCAVEDDCYTAPIFEVVAAGLLLPTRANSTTSD